MAENTPMAIKKLLLPKIALCTEDNYTHCKGFSGDITLDHAFFLGYRKMFFLFIHDLNMFEKNKKGNFILCENSDISIYKQYLKLLNFKDVKLYSCNEIKQIDEIVNVPYKLTPEINNRWRMKHRGLITQPLKIKNIILYNPHDSSTNICYIFNDKEKWLAEDFTLINTSTAPVQYVLNAVANADKIICATYSDYCYAIYCKPGCSVYYIKQQKQNVSTLSGINVNYNTGLPLFNLKYLPTHETFDNYKKINTSDV